MAKLGELKTQHFRKELEQRGLLATESKAELQTPTRFYVGRAVFQLEAEGSSIIVEPS